MTATLYVFATQGGNRLRAAELDQNFAECALVDLSNVNWSDVPEAILASLVSQLIAYGLISSTVPFQPLASAPTDPSDGQSYLDTTLGYPRIYIGSSWYGIGINPGV